MPLDAMVFHRMEVGHDAGMKVWLDAGSYQQQEL
jgi:hypothetical protein